MPGMRQNSERADFAAHPRDEPERRAKKESGFEDRPGPGPVAAERPRGPKEKREEKIEGGAKGHPSGSLHDPPGIVLDELARFFLADDARRGLAPRGDARRARRAVVRIRGENEHPALLEELRRARRAFGAEFAGDRVGRELKQAA